MNMDMDNVREDGTVDTDFGDYCEHGTYIGTPLGPDFICGWCEDGVPYEEFLEIQREHQARKMIEQIKASLWGEIFDVARTFACRPTGRPKADTWAVIFEEWIKLEKESLEDLDFEEATELWRLL